MIIMIDWIGERRRILPAHHPNLYNHYLKLSMPDPVNHLDHLLRDWGSWNRAFSKLTIRARGYELTRCRKCCRQ